MVMRRSLQLATSCLLALASISLALSATFVYRDQPAATSGSEHRNVVVRFYDAVNTLIGTGDRAALREIVHPEFVDVGFHGGESGIEGLESYLLALREIDPSAAITANTLTDIENRTISSPSIDLHAPASLLGFETSAVEPWWPPIETFEIQEDKIIERRAFREPRLRLAPTDVSGFPMVLPKQRDVHVYLIQLEPGTRSTHITLETASLVHPLSGELIVSINRASLTHQAQGIHSSASPSPGNRTVPMTLQASASPGTTIVVPNGAKFAIVNNGVRLASTLFVTSALSAAVSDAYADPEMQPIPVAEGILIHRFSDLGEQSALRMSVGDALIMPGAVAHLTENAHSIVITDSDLIHTVRGSGECQIRELPIGLTLKDPRIRGIRFLCLGMSRGDSLVNAGNAPVRLWVVAVTEAPGP
jgi:hypothetical protein